MHGGCVRLCVNCDVCFFVKKKRKKKERKKISFFVSLYELLETFRALMKHPRQTDYSGRSVHNM